MENILNQFKNPSSEYRGKPFWSWNGKLEKEELLRQIGVMKDMGMGGYFCHSRTGLATEYLGNEWFDLINTCAEEGEKLGLQTWLYDEDRWPSGTAGGMVTENPQYRMKYMRLTITDSNTFEWKDDIIAVFSAEIDGNSFTHKKRIYDHKTTPNSTYLIFTIEEMGKSSFYNGYTYVDTMNREATDKFIEITHNQYKEKCGERFSKSIKGIFTDEPHRGSVMCGFSYPNENPEYITPYTNELFAEFKRAFNYDLIDFLPELFLWDNGEKISQIKWNYMELLQRLFINNFLKPIYNWCKENSIALTGHMLHEDSLTAQTCMIGSVMRAYEYMECPGVDVLSEHNCNYWIVKQLASAARQLGKKNMLSELYGATGWQMNFQSHKVVGDWQALMGINMRCHHLSWYTMEGQAKRDYPASILHQSAWYKEYKYVEDYYARIHVLMSQGEPICNVLVLNPVESAWSLIYPGWSKGCFETADDDIRKIENIYSHIFNIFMYAKIDFDYGDEEMISRLYKIVKENDEVYLQIGKARYKTVLCAGMLTIRNSTIKILIEFIKEGGNVIFAGETPNYVDAAKSEEAQIIGAKYIDLNDDVIITALNDDRFVSITDKKMKNIDNIYAQIRENDDDYIIFLLNINREESFNDANITINSSGYLEYWDVRTGERYLEANNNDKIAIKLDFAPGEEKIYTLTKKDNKLTKRQKQNIVEIISLPREFEYKLSEANICVLDYVKLKICNDLWQDSVEVLKADMNAREYYKLPLRGGEMIQPWYESKNEKNFYGNVSIKYEFNLNSIPENVKLCMENPESFEIFMNDKKISVLDMSEWWCDKCFKVIDIDKSYLFEGLNEIMLTCNFTKSHNLEAVYIMGDFNVEISGIDKTITKSAQTIKAGDITNQGLPFFGASISYIVENIKKPDNGKVAILRIDKFDAACVNVKSGEKSKIIAFKPFEVDITELLSAENNRIELEYVLTRRNTFGPLHINPINPCMYGPASYTTTGESFLDDRYGLMPQGMTGQVEIVYCDVQ
jgi:hypothetical protein